MIIGCGPAGLACAERLGRSGQHVLLVDGVRGAGRKFLVAGRSGLNLTHDASGDAVLAKLGHSASRLHPAITAWPPSAIRAWAAELNTPTFVGTSGKVFPEEKHAAGLLHRWLTRLDAYGITRVHNQTLTDLRRGKDHWLVTTTDTSGQHQVQQARRVVLACGGASWPQTGSRAEWVPLLQDLGVQVTPFTPANCGIDLAPDPYLQRYAGSAIKDLACRSDVMTGHGEVVVTASGLEGNALYPVIPAVRTALAEGRPAIIWCDCVRRRSQPDLTKRLAAISRKVSFANRVRKAARLSPQAIALVRHAVPEAPRQAPAELAATLKQLPLTATALSPLAEAISSAGGVAWESLNEQYECRTLPGLHCIGEMVDWEAPTGGWLLSTCLAMGWWLGDHLAKAATGHR